MNRMQSDGGPPPGVKGDIYAPRNAIKLGLKSTTFMIRITRLLPYLNISPGDTVEVVMDSDSDPPMLAFIRVDDASDKHFSQFDGSSPLRTVQGEFDDASSHPVTLPKRLVTSEPPAGLGINPDTYDTANPLIFQPLFEEGGEFFGLVPLGRASNLFRNPKFVSCNPLPKDGFTQKIPRNELISRTSYTGDGRIEISHVCEYEAAIASKRDGGVVFPSGAVLVVEDNQGIETVFIKIEGDEWVALKRSTYDRHAIHIPSSLTTTLLERLGVLATPPPVSVERDGNCYKIVFVKPFEFPSAASSVYQTAVENCLAIELTHTHAAKQYLQEMARTRGDSISETHHLFCGECNAFIIPEGKAKQWVDSPIAVSPLDEIHELDGKVVQEYGLKRKPSTEEPTEQSTLSESHSPETSGFWETVPFKHEEIAEYVEEGMNAEEIATEVGFNKTLIEDAIERLSG